MNMTGTNHFTKFQALGYTRLVPIIPPDADISDRSSLSRALGKENDPRGKAVGIKGRDGKWFGYNWVPYEGDAQDMTRWQAMGAGVGIKTGQGLVLIDADTKNLEHAKIIRDQLALLIPDPSLIVRVGNYPKAGYVVRTDPDFRYSRIEFGDRDEKGRLLDRVEILSEGRQFVAHGIHPKTNKPYQWPKGVPHYDALPFISGDLLLAFLENLRHKLPSATHVSKEGSTPGETEVNQEALRGDLQTVRKAVRAIPNTSELFPTRESYRDFGYAIKAALPDNAQEAFDLFAEWCDRWENDHDEVNDPDVVASDWRRMKPPFRRGAGWLYELAERVSKGQFTQAEVWFDALPDSEIDLNPFKDLEAKAEKPKKKFHLVDFDAAAAVALEQSNRPLVKGFIDQGTMSVIYGDSNVGKTFVAMDLAFHIGAGIDYAGMKTTRGLVVYVAAEGGNGAKRRIAAMKEKYGDKADGVRFKLLASPIDLRRPDVDLNAFIETLQAIGEPISLIVVDTLSRALAGGDENSSVDMGAIVKHFDAIRDATAAHLMIVHHTGKNKAAGARGHSLLRAATDTEIEVAEGVISVTKQRDLDKSWSSGFDLEVRTLGIDEDMDPITSCTVRLVSKQEAGPGRIKLEPTAAESRVLECLEYLIEDLKVGANGVTVEQLLAGSGERLGGMNAELLRAHLRNLKEKGHVVRPKRGFWALETEDFASSVSETERNSEDQTEENGRKRNVGIFD